MHDWTCEQTMFRTHVLRSEEQPNKKWDFIFIELSNLNVKEKKKERKKKEKSGKNYVWVEVFAGMAPP